jgi:hypothetical protein
LWSASGERAAGAFGGDAPQDRFGFEFVLVYFFPQLNL